MRSFGRRGIFVLTLFIVQKLCHTFEPQDASQTLSNFQSAGSQASPFSAAGQSSSLSSNTNYDPVVSDELGRNVMDFAIQVGNELLRTSGKNSEVYSPASIYGALALLLLGSNGQTYNELIKIMGFQNDAELLRHSYKIHEQFGLMIEDVLTDFPLRQRPKPNWKLKAARPTEPTQVVHEARNEDETHKIEVVNGLFIQDGYSLRTPYARALESVYHSDFKPLDFLRNATGSREFINNWVNYNTHGRIPNIVDDIDPSTKIILASALYFKAMWEKTFFEGATMPRDFYPDGVDSPGITAEMMAHGGVFPYYDSIEYDCRILAFPYKKNLTTMYVILPNNSTRQKLRSFQQQLTAEKIDYMISRMEWKTAVILFPKMHITNTLKLERVLKSLGVQSLFNPATSDLSLISPGVELPIFQKPVGDQPAAFSAPLNVQQTRKQSQYENLEDYLIFSSDRNTDQSRARGRRSVSHKTKSAVGTPDNLTMKDLILNKRYVKAIPRKKQIRGKRDVGSSLDNLKSIDILREQIHGQNPGLFADDIIHKIDLIINEKGTEGGAATYTSLYRTGTDVVFRVDTPFIFLIRHDETKLPIFYGSVYQPTN